MQKVKFVLSEMETERYHKFSQEHRKCNALMEICIIPTGIGNIVSVKCKACGKIKDITDIDSW